MTILTDLEKKMVLRIAGSDYGTEPGDHTWTNCICDNLSDAGVLGSLVKKGLIGQQDHGRDATTWLSAEGIAAARELGYKGWDR